MTHTTRKFVLLVVFLLAFDGTTASAQQSRPSPWDTAPKESSSTKDPMQLPAMKRLAADLYQPRLTPEIKQSLPKAKPDWATLYDFDKPTALDEKLAAAFRRDRVMDVNQKPSDRAEVLKWKKQFPKLGTDFEVIGSGTPNASECATRAGLDGKTVPGSVIPGTYNCIAHTAGIKNVWVNPYQTTTGWNLYYAPLGFRASENLDLNYKAGLQKVAVYATKTDEGKVKKYTHAAIQDLDGTWTSKLGDGPLIRHRTADAVSGPSYGEVVLVYVKK